MTAYDEATEMFNSPDFPPKEGYLRRGDGVYLPYIEEGNKSIRSFLSDEERDEYLARIKE